MQDSYQGKCVLSGIWEDNCIMAHQNATGEPIVPLIILTTVGISKFILLKPFLALGSQKIINFGTKLVNPNEDCN